MDGLRLLLTAALLAITAAVVIDFAQRHFP